MTLTDDAKDANTSSSSLSDNESLQAFANTTLHTERHYNGNLTQADQVESLSGIIQEAIVEVIVSSSQAQLDVPSDIRLCTMHTIRSTWPSSPGSCSTWLPEMVFAIPSDIGCNIRILYAGINGIWVKAEENMERENKSSSRMIQLKLPALLKQASKLDFLLLYTQDSLKTSQICAFPPVASSIAQLTVKIEYESLNALQPIINFSLHPLSLKESRIENTQSYLSRAHMLPSMANVSFTLMQKFTTPIPIVGDSSGSLRRSSLTSKAKRIHAWPILLLLLSVILAAASFVPCSNSKPHRELQDKVDTLALALNIDFSDGTWSPYSAADQSKDYLHSGAKQQAAKHLPHKIGKSSSRAIPFGPQEISRETRSLIEILHSLLSWPYRKLFDLIYGD